MSTPLDCPLCQHAGRTAFTAHGYAVCDCPACGHRYADVPASAEHTRTVYGDDYFAGGGAGYADYLAEARLLRQRGQWYARKLSRYMPAGEMLDVGAAAGFVLQGFVDCGWRGAGLEPNAGMAAYAQRELGLAVQVGTLETLANGQSYDLVSMIQVLAHLTDLRRALAAAAAVTRPGGHWLIETWNKDSWTARLFGQGWHEYSPPSVLHWFSPATLEKLATEFGMTPVARGRPSKWINGGHAKSLLAYKLSARRWSKPAGWALGLLPDHLPLPYPGDDLFWMLLKKR